MQITANTLQNTAVAAHRATQAPCAVTLPYVDPLTQSLVGQTVTYKGKAKRLFCTPLPTMDSVTYQYESVSKVLKDAIHAGAINSEETRNLLNIFDNETDPQYVIHTLQSKIDNLAIADDLDAIYKNASDIYDAVHALGYKTEDLCVGDIVLSDGGLHFGLSEALRLTVIDDSNLPYPVQLGLSALTAYFANLCDTATEDAFINRSEDFETLSCLPMCAKRALIDLDKTLDDSRYLCEFEALSTDNVWSEFMDIMENYYGYYIENDEHHCDIAEHIKSHTDRLAFGMACQFQRENHYTLKQGKKLKRRLNRLSRHYAKHACANVLQQLIDLMDIAVRVYRPAYVEFTFLTDAYSLDFQQAVCMKSIENSVINDDISESEKHIMQTGEYAEIVVDTHDKDFMAVWRNYQLGWLLLHCLEQTMTEYQRHV